MWSCITITCSDAIWAKAIKEEIDIFNNQNLLNSELPCLVLQNPQGSVRNGEASLNALLSSVEWLCNNRGFENVCVVYVKRINLIIFIIKL